MNISREAKNVPAGVRNLPLEARNASRDVKNVLGDLRKVFRGRSKPPGGRFERLPPILPFRRFRPAVYHRESGS
jgi:hypothetical protein